MGVHLDSSTPRNPYRSTSIVDDILNAAGGLGDGFGAGLDGLLGLVGDLLQGAAEVGGLVLEGAINLANGVLDFFGNIGRTIVSLLTKDPPAKPLPPVFNPIFTDLEGAIAPYHERIDSALAESAAQGEIVQGEAAEALRIAREASAAVQDAGGVIALLVEEGKQALADTRVLAGQAQDAATVGTAQAVLAKGYADTAQAINDSLPAKVTEITTLVGQAQTAQSGAATSLTTAQGVLEDVTADAADVSAKLILVTTAHQDVLTKHQAVITAHGNALTIQADINTKQIEINTALSSGVRAAAVSAGQANMAAMMNSQAIEQVAIATQKALEATQANAEALVTLGEAQEKAAEASSRAFEAQGYRDDAQDYAMEAQADATEALLQGVSRTMFLARNQTTYDTYVRATPVGSHNWKIEALGNWLGNVTFQSVYETPRGFEPVLDGRKIEPTGRTSEHISYQHHPSILTYWVSPGTAGVHEPALSGFNVPYNSWTTVSGSQFTAKITGSHKLVFRVGWDSTMRSGTSYGIRIRRAGVTLDSVLQQNIGPWTSFESGYRTQSIQLNSLQLSKDDVLTFEVFSTAPLSGDQKQRTIRDLKLSISWINPPE